MNKIVISKKQKQDEDAGVLALSYESANKMMAILRSDHFRLISLEDVAQLQPKSLKFLIQLSRLLKPEGVIELSGGENKEIVALLSRLGLHEGEGRGQRKVFLRRKPQVKEVEEVRKLAIGFKSNQGDEQIDEGQLLEGENIDLKKKKEGGCSTKVRACANCNCGRKDAEQNVSKEELVKSINEGKPMAGCGKCSMGDSFRCGTCPYRGLPAFKPGDKLKLQEEGGVSIEQGSTVVSATGKVKLDL